MDPNLVELFDEGAPDDEISAVIRLRARGEYPEKVRPIAEIGEFITCRLRRADIPEVRSDPRVASMKAPDPMIPEETVDEVFSGEQFPSDERRPPSIPFTGHGVVVATIDWGIDFANPAFVDEGSRFRAIWDQRGEATQADNPYGYGKIHRSNDINRVLGSSNPYEALDYHPSDADLLGTGSHGTHVVDIAAGNGRDGGPVGIAPRADLLFCHLRSDIGGLQNLGDSCKLIEAIHWVLHEAGGDPLVLNLSLGNHGGPHDGSTIVEMVLDFILRERPGRAISQSVGNYAEGLTHTVINLRPGETSQLFWDTDEADVTPNELEIWYSRHDRIRAEIKAPTGETSGFIPLGERGKIDIGSREVCRVHHRASDPNNRDHLVNIFILPGAPAGRWTVTVIGEDIADGRLHAWIERDEACRNCQSRFPTEVAVSHGTNNTISNGLRTISVGAYDPHRPFADAAPFSSMGPTRDGRAKPDLCAPGVRILAAKSIGPDGTRGLVRKSGTSMAAPHVAGCVALMFEAARTPLGIDETRRLLLSTSAPIDEEARDRVGSGLLDIERAVEAAASVRGQVPTREFALIGAGPRGGKGMDSESEQVHLAEIAEVLLEDELTVSQEEVVEQYLQKAGGTLSETRGLIPAALFDAFAFGDEIQRAQIGSLFEIIGSPGGTLSDELREGDVVLRRALGEGKACGLDIVDGSADPQSVMVDSGRVPLDRMILRPRMAPEATSPALASGSAEAAEALDLEGVRPDEPLTPQGELTEEQLKPLQKVPLRRFLPNPLVGKYAVVIGGEAEAQRIRDRLLKLARAFWMKSDLKWAFPYVYALVSEEITSTARAGGFRNSDVVYHWMANFYEIYALNLDSFLKKNYAEDHWDQAFRLPQTLRPSDPWEARSAAVFIVSMFAHIKSDLPRALAYVFLKFYAHKTNPATGRPWAFDDFKGDYDVMNKTVFPKVIERVARDGVVLPGVTNLWPGIRDAWLNSRLNLAELREEAWRVARGYVADPAVQRNVGFIKIRSGGTAVAVPGSAEEITLAPHVTAEQALPEQVREVTIRVRRRGGRTQTMTVVVGGIRFDRQARDDVLRNGALLPGPDQAHIAFHGDLLGYDRSHSVPSDPFRWNKIKELIDSGEEIRVMKRSLAGPIRTQFIFQGRRMVIDDILRSLGLTLPKESLHRAVFPNATRRLVSPVANESHIYYTSDLSTPAQSSLAHELLGHMWLAVRRVPFVHPSTPSEAAALGTLNRQHNIRDPFGNVFTGLVEVFIDRFIGSQSGVLSSPTQNVGQSFLWNALRSFQSDFRSKVTWDNQGRCVIPGDVRLHWEVITNNHSAAPATAPQLPPDSVVAVSQSEIERRIGAFVRGLSLDQKRLFRCFLNALPVTFGSRSTLASRVQTMLGR